MMRRTKKPVRRAIRVVENDWPAIRIEFDLDKDLVREVRSLPNIEMRGDAGSRYWMSPLRPTTLEKLSALGFSLDKRLTRLLQLRSRRSSRTERQFHVPGLAGELMPFQVEGVRFIDKLNGRALIGDDMGLGKTIQALAWLQLHLDYRPAVVVVPASLKLNWEKEANKWMPSPKIQILSGRPNREAVELDGEIFVINYDILSNRWLPLNLVSTCVFDRQDFLRVDYVSKRSMVKYLNESTWVERYGKRGQYYWLAEPSDDVLRSLHKMGFHFVKGLKSRLKDLGLHWKAVPPKKRKEIKWTGWIDYLLKLDLKVMVVDECHFIKSNKTRRTLAVQKLGRNVPYVVGLSGTPFENRPVELYNPMKLVNPIHTPPFWPFVTRFCGAKQTGFGWDYNGATNTEELHELLSEKFMIRRKKVEVLKQLPEKTHSMVPLKLDDYTDYYQVEEDFIKWLKKECGEEAAKRAKRAKGLTRISALRSLVAKHKLPAALQWIKDFLESGEKLIVFARHRVVINAVMEAFGPIAVRLDGSIGKEARQESVDRFQSDDRVRLFVGEFTAAGMGWTLTASSSVAFLEYPWSPGKLIQAEDRAYRIGQERAVVIYFLLAVDTIDERFVNILGEKKGVLDAVLDGKDMEETSVYEDLLESYLNS